MIKNTARLEFYSIFLLNLVIFSFITADNGYTKIHLITTNDLHGQIVGQKATFMNPEFPPDILDASAMYKYVNNLRLELESRGEGVILLDGGNFFQGHPFGIADSGKTMIKWMNRLKYDALVPGSYDFIVGTKNLVELSELSEFPFLIANGEINYQVDGIKPYSIILKSGIKIGVIGIVPKNLEDSVLEQNRNGLSISSEIEALDYWIPIMKNDGAEVIIILTSLGIPWDRQQVYKEFLDSLSVNTYKDKKINNALELGYYSKEIDFIISGGISKGYPEVWYDPHSHVFISQNYGNGTEFGHIILKIDNYSNRFLGFETAVDGRVGQTMLADDFSFDKEMSSWIKSHLNWSLDKVYESPLWEPVYDIESGCQEIPRLVKTKHPMNVNREDEIEIITWNTEFFPAHKDSTLPVLANVISNLNADIIAFQEIRFTGYFS